MRSSSRYQQWRSAILRNEPSCRSCAEAGFTVGAEHIDHIEPAHLAPERFWDRDNVQPIYRECHDRKTAGEQGMSLEAVCEREAWKRVWSNWRANDSRCRSEGPESAPHPSTDSRS